LIQIIVSRKGLIDNEGNLEERRYQLMCGDRTDRMPKLWTLFGVRQVEALWLPDGKFTNEELQQIRTAFPEVTELKGRVGGKKVSPLVRYH